MTYELAKQLQDKGFPTPEDWDKDFSVFFPTLSELIEACGIPFDLINYSGKEWEAEHSNGVEKAPERGYGSTPEEAVAKLWLELQK